MDDLATIFARMDMLNLVVILALLLVVLFTGYRVLFGEDGVVTRRRRRRGRRPGSDNFFY